MTHDEKRKRIARESLLLIASARNEINKRLRDELPTSKAILGVSETARILGMSRQGVYNLLNERNRTTESRFTD